ncbi:uncharacterized protein LOC111394389 isoform X3 [Olea europaea subsp. europaea]|uniref:Uncharacterized protein LOC111394389 isoform X3 n=1 Tax=Olea europaea subsp. europaea TaxID=158383 RepID=A0A8S0UVJ0_OLEEU|nr:uncharacterized protein LOC111394389 isoform X3 [Olea europaea subsp. europaea]
MAQYRQSGGFFNSNGGMRNGGDQLSIGMRGGGTTSSVPYHHRRRFKGPHDYKISIGCCIVILAFILSVSVFFYFALQSKDTNWYRSQDNDIENDTDFLMNVTRTQKSKELKFGRGSVLHGRDSRYWDKDDRRRDVDYNEEELNRGRDGSTNKVHAAIRIRDKKSSTTGSHKASDNRRNGLYNEAGRDELKMYEAEYEASLKSSEQSKHVHSNKNQQSGDADWRKHGSADDEYDDGIDLQDDEIKDDDDVGHDDEEHSGGHESHRIDGGESSHLRDARNKNQKNVEEGDKVSSDLANEESLSISLHSKIKVKSRHVSSLDGQSVRRTNPERHSGSKRKPKRRRTSGSCEMKMLNSSSLLVEPLESRKFARFSLQYTETEEKPTEDERWLPKFAGHQRLKEREESFIAHDQKINCGFVRGPKGSSGTGFDLAEDDAKYMSSCHIAVMSCIFGNSDRLRSPVDKMVSRLSRKNICFVMFVDEVTLHMLSSEGQVPDRMGFIGLWKIVVVKNLPYTDMRRVGKIPKFLPHRLFPSARYSIWLDSKLRLQLDPMLILEYFLWRKGYEYAISNHYDRHCLWEEVAQNKKLNKYNHTVIDEQFAFYQNDGMKKFNASDPNKLLPSNVPEGSFIVRAHTPMSNLFSCLWFNEVERFTPRDQLSFAYTYHKLRRMNPEKPFYLNMFKDCERRKIAKLFHHRSEEKGNITLHETA